MNVLVTGGAGFIGSTIVARLRADGHAVAVFDDLSTGDRANLPADVSLIEGDVRDLAALTAAAAGRDALIHMAAMVSVPGSVKEPDVCYAINVEGTRNALEAARRQGAKRVVMASSAAVYGEGGGGAESVTVSPASPYAYSKWQNEVDAAYYAQYMGVETACMRFFNVYGPKQRPDSPYSGVISIAARLIPAGSTFTVFGDGGQTRDFVYVEDVARAVVAAATVAGVGQGAAAIFNVGRGKQLPLMELLSTIAKLSGQETKLAFAAARAGDVYHSCADATRLREQLGVVAETDLETGLATTLGWMRSRATTT